MAQSLSRWLEAEQAGPVTVVHFVRKRLWQDEAVEAVGEELFRLVDEEGRRLIVLSLAGVQSLGSRMLGKVDALHKQLQSVGGRLALCQASPFLEEFFTVTDLPSILAVRGDELEAVQALTASP